jgi:hypothetical protein
MGYFKSIKEPPNTGHLNLKTFYNNLCQFINWLFTILFPVWFLNGLLA